MSLTSRLGVSGRRGRMLAIAIAMILGLAILAPAGAAAEGPDWAISNGWFFTQTGGGQEKGFSVTDDGDTKFLRSYSELGGVGSLGYPISWRYVGADGFIYQAFQGGVLQWAPGRRRPSLANTFEMLQEAGKDPVLARKGVPAPITDDGAKGDFEKAKQTRLSWMTEPAIHDYFMSPPAAEGQRWGVEESVNLFGLPMSKPQRSGPFIVQRFQRVALQLWVDAVPGMPAPGTVVPVLGGDMLKEAGLLPANSLAALSADHPYLRIDPALRKPIDILAASKTGSGFARLVLDRQLPVVVQHIDSSSILATFEYSVRYSQGQAIVTTTPVLSVNAKLMSADTKALATVLAHEGKHAEIFFTHTDANEKLPGCVEQETAAYQVGAIFWREMYGPKGKQPPKDALERSLNNTLKYADGQNMAGDMQRVCTGKQ